MTLIDFLIKSYTPYEPQENGTVVAFHKDVKLGFYDFSPEAGLELDLKIPKEWQKMGLGSEIFQDAVKATNAKKFTASWLKGSGYEGGMSTNLKIYLEGLQKYLNQFEDLLDIKGLKLQKLGKSVPLVQIRDGDIDLLKREIKTSLDSLLSHGIVKQTEYTLTQVQYENKTIELNLRDNGDFYIAALIDIFDMIVLCARLESTLFIYNRELLSVHEGESIVAFLRGHHRLSRQALKDGLNELRQSAGFKDWHIDYETLDAGLKNLQNYGYIHPIPKFFTT